MSEIPKTPDEPRFLTKEEREVARKAQAAIVVTLPAMERGLTVSPPRTG